MSSERFRTIQKLSSAVIILTILACIPAASASILFIGQGYAPPNRIWSYDTDAPSPSLQTLTASEPGYLADIFVDPIGNRMYWTVNGTLSTNPGWIRSANLDGSDLTTLRSGSATGHTFGISADILNGHLYYASNLPYPNNGAVKGLVKMNLDGSNPHTFIATDNAPHCVEIDPLNQKIYWSENNNQVRRANLDGSGIENVFTASGYYIKDMELDLDRGLIYLIEDKKITKTSLDGSSTTEIFSYNASISSLALSPDGNIVYVGDTTNERVYQMNNDGSDFQLTAYANNPFALEAVPEPASLTLISLAGLLLHRRRKA